MLQEAPVEGARRVRNQGTRESLDYGRSPGTTGEVNAKDAFFSDVFETDCQRAQFRKISGDVEATIWRIRETIWVGELAAMHRLGQMRRLLMHEKRKGWKRVFGFGRIETATEMDQKRSRTSTSPLLSKHGHSQTSVYP